MVTVMIWHHISALKTKVVSAAVCSNTVVLLLMIYCLLLLPLFVGVWLLLFFCQRLVMLYLVYNLVSNHLAEEERERVALL